MVVKIKKRVIKGKIKLEKYKNCFEGSQLENKINHIEKNKIILKRIINNL